MHPQPGFATPSLLPRTPGVAKRILETPEAELEANALKVKKLCSRGLAKAAENGTTNGRLYCIGLMIRNYMHIDTEECEGYNSLIRSFCRALGSSRLSLLGKQGRAGRKASTPGRVSIGGLT